MAGLVRFLYFLKIIIIIFFKLFLSTSYSVNSRWRETLFFFNIKLICFVVISM